MSANLRELPPLSAVPDAPSTRALAECWSHEDGPYPATGELQDKVCLLNNGELLIRQGTRMDPHVLRYEADLQQAQVKFKIVPVQLPEIREAYARRGPRKAGGGTTKAESVRQAEVVQIIRDGIQQDASDVHFILTRDSGVIRHRVNGVMETVDHLPLADMQDLMGTMYQSMCDVAEEYYKPHKAQDARLSEDYLRSTGLYGARIATRPTAFGSAVVLRLLYNSNKRPTELAHLGYLPSQQEFFQKVIQSTEGIYIFSGPTGSGKSTSMQVACVEMMRHFDNCINGYTLEDPPEYTIDGWQQTPVERDERGFAAWELGIRSLMRMDLDVAMIGEMRDVASMRAGAEIGITGHKVLTSVHANCAVSILQRLQGKGLERELYADPGLMAGLINQKLAPTLCEHCKRPWITERGRFEPSQAARIERFCDPSRMFVRNVDGCSRCRRGISGRQVIAETIDTTQEFMRVFAEKGRFAARQYWVKEMGGTTRTDHLKTAIEAGRVDPVLGEQQINLLDIDEDLHGAPVWT